MNEPNREKTWRRCHDCLQRQNTNYMWASIHREGKHGNKDLWMLECLAPECGSYEFTTDQFWRV